ncbi:MAG: plasmid pRiA4b ORF-3 family protein [Dehalococcoidia bacterium]
MSEFDYLYDLGDDWWHRLVIEPNAPKVVRSGPLCLAGENACPPEDVGGPPGYEEFLAAMANPKHRRHRGFAEWSGGVWDPKGSDLNAVNRALRVGVQPWRASALGRKGSGGGLFAAEVRTRPGGHPDRWRSDRGVAVRPALPPTA